MSRDEAAGWTGAALFSCALGVAGVAVPLLAIRIGYGPTALGVLIALSAVSQMAVRLFMGAMLRRLPDRVFVIAAGAALALSCGLAAVSGSVVVLVVSQLLQGAARGFFWTGTQTHAVRTTSPSVRALARLNVAAGIGQLAGPALAGLLTELSAQLALAVGTATAAAGAIVAALLVRLEPFAAPGHTRRRPVWRQQLVGAACWAGATAGAWRGLLGSYVPLALAQAAQSPATIGLLVSVANGASLVGSGIVGRVRGRWVVRSMVFGVIVTGVGLGAVGLLAGVPVPAGLALAVSGIGAGVLQTVGPAMAADAVPPAERGDAVAATGTFRAAALFLAPFGMAGIVLAAPVGAALVLAGGLMAVPAVLTRAARS